MLATYQGVELPVYDEWEVNWNKRDIERAARSGEPYFVRRMRLIGPQDTNLRKVLNLADLVLAEAGARLEVEVIKPKWGLARLSNRRLACSDPHPSIPRGFDLVARVPTVPNTQPLSTDQAVYTQERIERYQKGYHPLGFRLLDLKPHDPNEQFVASQQSVTLVDVEPRLCPVPSFRWRQLPSDR